MYVVSVALQKISRNVVHMLPAHHDIAPVTELEQPPWHYATEQCHPRL